MPSGASPKDMPQPERVNKPEDEYEELEYLFAEEHLGENFELVEDQLERIRILIKRYDELYDRREKELGKKDEIDEVWLSDIDTDITRVEDEVAEAFRNFKINNKIVDLIKLVKIHGGAGAPGAGEYWDYCFNGVVYEINRYVEYFMIGKSEQPIAGI